MTKIAARNVVQEVSRPVWGSRQAALSLRAPAKEHETFEPDRVLTGIRKAVEEVGLEATGDFEVRWQPYGLSCGIHGKRFHLYLHTWPEHALSTLDVWVSGLRIERLIVALEAALGWRRIEHDAIQRLETDR